VSFCPGWFRPWCEAHSLNADRPDRWPETARAAFMAEKIAAFKRHWAWLSTLGQPALIRQQSGREELIRQVRRDLDDALSPCPEYGPHDHVRSWPLRRIAGSTDQSEPWDEITIEDALAYVEAHPGTERLAVRTVKCLVWLTREFAVQRTKRIMSGSAA